jgi:DNA-binding NarL/FixJ family response regulator
MPGLDRLKASRQILRKKPDAPILMVSVFASQQLADEAKRAGIKGSAQKAKPNASSRPSKCYCAAKNVFPQWCTDRFDLSAFTFLCGLATAPNHSLRYY